MAVWAKSTGAAVDHDLTVTGLSSGEEKTTARPTTRMTTTTKAMVTSLIRS
jgi:hypothetical protein